MFTSTEVNRYMKQMLLPDVGVPGQQRLKQARVAVVGAGGLGCPVLQYLVAAGVGSITIIDPDVVDVSNLHRQVLYHTADVGRAKALVAQEKLSAQNPFCNIIPQVRAINAEHANELLCDADLVIDGCDNFATRYVVNDACVRLGKALVYGSILGDEGQVAVFNYKGSKHLRDIFPEPPLAGDVPDCSENGVLGPVPGIIGAMMANAAMNIILERKVLTDQYILFNTLTFDKTILHY